MTPLDRRSILAGVAALPFLPALSVASKTIPSNGTRWLYAYIHGAFVIEFQSGGVRIIAPKIADTSGKLMHEYRVGYLPNGEGMPLHPGFPVALMGFPGATTPAQLDKTALPCFDNTPVNMSGDVYCGVILPTPNAVVPLRQVPLAADNTPFFSNAKLSNLKWLPLLLMLQYELQPTDRPVLIGAGDSWKDDGRSPLILHFRAEPGSSANAQHEAWSQMQTIVNERLELARCYTDCLSCGKNTEEQSLIELRNPAPVCTPVLPCTKRSSGTETIFSRPANCVGVILNNT